MSGLFIAISLFVYFYLMNTNFLFLSENGEWGYCQQLVLHKFFKECSR